MKKILLFAFAIAFSAVIYAQQEGPTISWTTTVHDFGVFKEEAGLQTAKFEFVNTGNAPLFITNVKASCGCTTPEWTKEPVQPGAKGYVTATYNPANRPGKFNKSITVTTNEFQPTSVIRIEGEVIPKPVETAPTPPTN
jgi:hypothetical protein